MVHGGNKVPSALCRRQFALNGVSCFLGKIRKISSICCLLKMPRKVKVTDKKKTVTVCEERKINRGYSNVWSEYDFYFIE